MVSRLSWGFILFLRRITVQGNELEASKTHEIIFVNDTSHVSELFSNQNFLFPSAFFDKENLVILSL